MNGNRVVNMSRRKRMNGNRVVKQELGVHRNTTWIRDGQLIKKWRISRVNAKNFLHFRGCGFQLQNLLGPMSQRPLARA